MKLLEKIKFLDEREIRLLDLPIVHYGTKKVENAKEKYIDFFPNKTFEEQVIEEIVNFIDDKYDSIYLLRSGLGEAYLVNFLIKNWCKKNNSKNPCFLNPKNPQKWWSIFSPLPMCFLNMNWQKLKVLQKSCYSIKNKKIYVFLPSKEIRAICQKYLTNPRPHTLSLLKFVDLDTSSISPINFSFDDLTIEKCRKFLQNKNIDINNFIFISPDALSISALSNDFWNKLEIQLRNLGYYIYQN